MIWDSINKTDLTWQHKLSSDLVGLWVLLHLGAPRRKPWTETKAVHLSDQKIYTGFWKELSEGSWMSAACRGFKNALTVATGGLYSKEMGQSASLFMQEGCFTSLLLFSVDSFILFPTWRFEWSRLSLFRVLLPGLFPFCSITAVLLIRTRFEGLSCGRDFTAWGQIKILS